MACCEAVCLSLYPAFALVSLSLQIWISRLLENLLLKHSFKKFGLQKKYLLFGKLLQELLNIFVQWSRKVMISEKKRQSSANCLICRTDMEKWSWWKVGRRESEDLQLYRSWTRCLLKANRFSSFRKVSFSKHFVFSELQNREQDTFRDFLIEIIPWTCREMLPCSSKSAVQHTNCQVRKGFHVQLISPGYSAYGKVIPEENQRQ